MIEKPTSDAEQVQVDAIKQQIRAILGELRMLAKTEVGDEEFLSQLGRRTLETTGAAGFAIWQIDSQQDVTSVLETGRTSNQSGLDEKQLEMHNRLVRTVNASSRPTLIEPDAIDSASGLVVNPMACLLLLKPLQDPALQDQYVLELFQRPEIASAARTGYMRYLEEIGEIFAAWRARHQLRTQSSRHGKQQRMMEFIRDIHTSLHPREVAYAAANDGRLLAGCDRLSVLKFDGRNARVLAVSGQDDFDNRSNVVRKQQALASAVCRNGHDLWIAGADTEDLPRSTRELANDYLNESHSRTLGVVPLFSRGETAIEDNPDEPVPARDSVGAMIFEWFGQDVPRNTSGVDVETLTDHVGRALGNAQQHSSIFLLPVWQAIGKWQWLVQAKTLPKTVAVLAAVLALILFFCFFPWPLDMRVEGTLQPVEQQNVFANIDGVISHVYVRHGQAVRAGDLLLKLRNDELDYQLASANGQLQEIQQEIRATQASALSSTDDIPLDQSSAAAARLSALREKMTTIQQQIGLLRQMTAKLEVYSPIDGTIVSWDPVRQLTERPVGRQDVVLVVAAVDSDWQMELYIPERKYGHVARTAGDSRVTFFAATDPNKSYEGRIVEIESHATEHARHGNSVRAFASFDQQNAPDLYVGAAVTARIHCGTTSVGYAWFHELLEFFQSRVLF
jgi:multidrug efflux pump subunit AcrA (membrane-fusion protein)